jgi:hypothetical protein
VVIHILKKLNHMTTAITTITMAVPIADTAMIAAILSITTPITMEVPIAGSTIAVTALPGTAITVL